VPLLAKQYRVLTLDLQGHGQSDVPRDGKFSMDLFAQAVEAVRAEAKADGLILAGQGMGTQVVLRYARLYPQHTAALVFVDGVATRVGGPLQGGPEGRNNREIRIRSQFSAATTPEMQAKILKMTLAAPNATAVGTSNATGEALSHENGIVNVPVLAIYAEHSRLANREYLQTHFPNLEYTEISGTGHYLMLEKPEAFNHLLLTFLAKQK